MCLAGSRDITLFTSQINVGRNATYMAIPLSFEIVIVCLRLFSVQVMFERFSNGIYVRT